MVASTTYYISSSSGDDANEGKSPAKPWQHLWKVYLKSISANPFAPGDSILLKRGDQWRGQIRLQAHGEEQWPIVIGAYGQGQRPLLYGENERTLWEAVTGHEGLYTTDLDQGSILGAIVQNGTILRVTRPASGLERTEETDSFLATLRRGELAGQSGSRLWVRVGDGELPSATIHVFRLAGVSLAKSSYVRVENLDIRQFYSGMDIEKSQRVTIQHNDVQDVLGIGIYLRLENSDCMVESNTVYRSGNTALYNLKGSRNTFRDNWVSHVDSTILGIKVNGDAMGIGLQESQQTVVEYNYFAHSGGIDFYFERNSTIRYNYLDRVRSAGAPHGEDLNVYGNIYNLGAAEGKPGARGINAVATGPETIKVFSNTILNASMFFLKGSSAKGGKVEFSNNLAASTVAGPTMTSFGTNVTSNHNCFSAPGVPTFQYGGAMFSSLSAYQTASGLDHDSVFADPQFEVRSPRTPLDFRISAKSRCNSAASSVSSTLLSETDTYDHDHELTTDRVIGALRVDPDAGQTDHGGRAGTAHCFGTSFHVSGGVYLLTLKFAPDVLNHATKFSFQINGWEEGAEFAPSAPDASLDASVRFLVRPEGNLIVLQPDADANSSVVTEVDIERFDASHGDGLQVIPW